MTQRILNPANDITYLGSFKLPESGDPQFQNCQTFSYGGNGYQAPGGIGFNPAGNNGAGSLFIQGAFGGAGGCGTTSAPLVAEVSLPTPTILTSADYTQLNAASYLQSTPFGDLTGGLGLDSSITGSGSGGVCFGNMLFQNGKVFWTLYDGYDNGPTTASHGYSTSPGNLQSPGANGLFSLNDSAGAPIRATAGYIAEIPNDANGNWQTVFGGYTHFSGLSGPSIVSNSGNGPGMTCFKAADLIGQAAGYAASAKSYLFYPNGNNCSLWKPNFSTQLSGGLLVSSAQVYGLLFLGQQALTLDWYGYPTYYGWRNDQFSAFPANQDHPPLRPGMADYASYGNSSGWPADDAGSGIPPAHRYYFDAVTDSESDIGNKGVHQDAVQSAWWLYDPNTVANHVGNPWDLTPAETRFDANNTNNPWLGRFNYQNFGLAYDRANRKIYLLQGRIYTPDVYNFYPVIHVYQHP